jgi:hypothetical protein
MAGDRRDAIKYCDFLCVTLRPPPVDCEDDDPPPDDLAADLLLPADDEPSTLDDDVSCGVALPDSGVFAIVLPFLPVASCAIE